MTEADLAGPADPVDGFAALAALELPPQIAAAAARALGDGAPLGAPRSSRWFRRRVS
ncbi:MAG TPA: hypothetical protein VHO00_12325 [Actinomycetes bacterium]|nr:hypothetical protein [Actinomycetes bacterium]